QGPPPAINPLYRFNANVAPYTVANPPPWVYEVYHNDPGDPTARGQVWEQRAFPLLTGGNKPNGSTYEFFTTPGVRNEIRPSVEPNDIDGTSTQDYLFSRFAVVPMDVRIEAVMYAENGSFFVIPGYGVNPDPTD